MKKTKITYYLSTILLSVMVLVAAYLELSGSKEALDTITSLGYPEYLLFILGVAKIAGILGIWQGRVKFLREWAYAGLVIDFAGALSSHLFSYQGPEKYSGSIIAIILVVISYWSFKRLQRDAEINK
ncbi:DoxX family protein [Candidatus Nomurabacteria bacterium]|nr:DoxX family protein [Candidatus Nomurabacteria bacterium]